MFNPIKTFENKSGNKITPIWMDNQLVFIAQELSEYFEYSDLAHSVQTSNGMEEGKHYFVINGAKLSQLKELLRSMTPTDQPSQILDTIKFMPSLTLITESGFYALSFRSDKPECLRFRDWVTDDVLPEIHKTGKYSLLNRDNINLKKIKSEFKAAIDIAKMSGYTGNQNLLIAFKMIRKEYGKDLQSLMEIELKSEVQEKNMTPTEIGKSLTPQISAAKVNLLLAEKGLQNKIGDSWILTEDGKKYGIYLDTNKKHSDGTPVQQIKWKENILERLK